MENLEGLREKVEEAVLKSRESVPPHEPPMEDFERA